MISKEKAAKWIWYFGDYELFHSIKLHSRRQEFDRIFPPFWSLSHVYPSVLFKKEVEILEDDIITVFINGKGSCRVDNNSYAPGTPITVKAGKHLIEISAINATGLPAAYVRGKTIVSDESWSVSAYTANFVPVGCRDEYSKETDDVEVFRFSHKKIMPKSVTHYNGGILYDFGSELFGNVIMKGLKEDCTVYYGESLSEATSGKDAIIYEKVNAEKHVKLTARAVRYIFLDVTSEPDTVMLEYEYLPYKDVGSFSCDDSAVKKIYDVCAHTFRLCSREFYLDGIKRDRWVWSGDAYQSFMINRYICHDDDIIKRTVIALLGKPPYSQHINTINDYSMYLILAVYDYWFSSGDCEFVTNIYERLKSLFEFIVSRLDGNGFVCKREGDWIFIDWGEFDTVGPHCAEQILLYETIDKMEKLSSLVKDTSITLPDKADLKAKIYRYYYRKELGGFIDGFESGKEEIHRQQNIFAILYDFANDEEKNQILEKVLLNNNIEEIKTPYFKFYELIAVCKMGRVDFAQNMLSSYWGAMLAEGATSFWEQYDANVKGIAKYEMYGIKFGKSLCHAWGSGPIRLLGEFVAGVRITDVAGKTYEVRPNPGIYSEFSASVPINDGVVKVKYKDGRVYVYSTCEGGTLCFGGKSKRIKKNSRTTISL
ncbi:MAG: hypothetical protein SOZ62_02870 [Eubacteriales bacterium]|nr:hypothetical protein [Eubacteriales bacterium]